MRKKVILCGYNWSGCKALDLLLQRNYDVYVYTHENPYYTNSLIETCEKLKIDFTIEKISTENIPFTPNFICSIYYRYIIPSEIIEQVNGKIFNLHPSLLPKYKGCSSLTWAIINGEKEAGFSFHYISPKIDEGNIILQKSVKIEIWDTQQTLYFRVMFESMKYFNEVIDLVLKGVLGKEQKGIGTYYKRGCPNGAEIEQEWEFEKKERFIRAMIFPPLSVAISNGKEIKTIKDL